MTKLREISNLKTSSELISYQISEVKNLITNIDIKVDRIFDSLEKRVQELEKFRVAQEAKAQSEPVDWQKIVLSLIGVISTMVLAYTTARQTGVLK